MRSRWAGAGFLTSCVLLTIYWALAHPLADQPRYGLYSRRFLDFVHSYPVPGYADQYQFLGNAAAALGLFHVLNPPLLITTMGSDRFTGSETAFWRSDWRFLTQAVSLSFWWWWLLERLIQRRGRLRVTLAHVALLIPLLSLAVSFALYRSAWIRSPHGLAGFATVLPPLSFATLIFGVVWVRARATPVLRPGAVSTAIASGICLLLWPPQVLESWHPGREHHYSFAGHGWVFRQIEPQRPLHSELPTEYEFHIALSLLAAELAVVTAAFVASLNWRLSNPSLHRTPASPFSLRQRGARPAPVSSKPLDDEGA